MADRYWVGGTANWDSTAGTKWSTTSGGTGGASVPTNLDDVFFTNLSTGTVTIGSAVAKSVNCTGFTGTITGFGTLTVYGSITFVSGMGYTSMMPITIAATGTLTTAGKTIRQLTINAPGGTVTLGSALNTSTSNIFLNAGTFNTANYSLTSARIDASSGASAKTLTLGSSTLTFSTASTAIVTSFSNFTLNEGTSQINLTNTSARLDGETYYNVSFTSVNAGTRTILGTSTFNNLSMSSPTTPGRRTLSLGGNLTINGTFTCAGGNAQARNFVRSTLTTTIRTITAAAISANNCDFKNISLAGAASGAAPTRAGDCGNNSGITFPAPKTVYRIGSNSTWAGSSSWALSSNGVGSNDNIPLPQDTAVFSGTNGTLIEIPSDYNCSGLDCSARTGPLTLDHLSNTTDWYGSYILSSAVTVSGLSAAVQTFCGTGTRVIVTAGKTLPIETVIDSLNGTYVLQDALTINGRLTVSNNCTFDANNYNVTAQSFRCVSGSPTVLMKSGLWTLTSFSGAWETTSSSATINKGTANILLSDNSAYNRFIDIGTSGRSFNKLTIGGSTTTSLTILAGTGTFTELASTKTVAHTVQYLNSGFDVNTWSITGTAGNIVTVNSYTAGTRYNFTLTNVTENIDYLSVTDIGELSGGKFFVGTNSIDGGNNSNVYFTTPSALTTAGNMLMLF